MASPPPSSIEIKAAGPETFELTVIFDGQRFDCGRYLNRAAAAQAGKLFVQRKEGEAAGRKKSPRKK
jgi:hypothetical protein